MKDPYECPRCGYASQRKSSMYYHLYRNKKVCATLKSMIEITEDIKSHVLQFRRYIAPANLNQNMLNQTINNYNTVYNFIAGLDTVEKIKKLTDYKQIQLIDFEQSIEDRYSSKARRLQENKNVKYAFSLEHHDILQLIDNVSKVTSDEEFEYLNIVYDNKYDRFKIYEEGDWKELLRVIGINKIIHYLQDHYLDSYEIYLIRRHRNTDIPFINREKSLELLIKYYKFIGAFDIEPFIKGKSNNKVLYNADDPRYSADYSFHDFEHFTIEEEFYPIYQKTQDNITKSEMNEIKKNVLDILKKNSNKSIDQLNKKVTELFSMDEQFKSLLGDQSGEFGFTK